MYQCFTGGMLALSADFPAAQSWWSRHLILTQELGPCLPPPLCLLSPADCPLPLLLQHLWHPAVVPCALHAPAYPHGQGVGQTHGQVSLVRRPLPPPVLPAAALIAMMFLNTKPVCVENEVCNLSDLEFLDNRDLYAVQW